MNQSLSLNYSVTPPAATLAMPTQVLSLQPEQRAVASSANPWLARLITFGGSLALTLAASYQMQVVLPLTVIEATPWGLSAPLTMTLLWLLLGLFTVTFGWVALTAMAAVAGFVTARDQRLAHPEAPLRGNTVLLMPVYNEDPTRVCASLAAMAEDLDRLGQARHFEVFVVSDSDRPEIWPAETAAIRHLQEELSDTMPVWYRRRDKNSARKAGNIRDFINNWGNRYDYMVVLDADSLIAGDSLTTLVREMDADTKLGILQTLPRLIGGETLYARLQQFANAIYGPVFARGLSAWQGDDGNYWGHNAIIRVRAFAESAGLPTMGGPRPFGGEIRSHDFVEAALIRRAGWTVRMITDLPGSWEECPPTLLDAAVRDRRWAQGNVQHLGVLPAKGLRWPSRAHMVMGVMNYVTSPLWLASVLVGLILYSRINLQPADGSVGLNSAMFGAGQMFDSSRMIALIALTIGLLLLPKLLGLIIVVGKRRKLSESLNLLAGAILEQLFSILHAPIVMSLHSRHLWEIVCGQDSGWSAQQRRGRLFPLAVLLRRHGGQTFIGILTTTYLVWLASPLLYWVLPMAVGLIFSVPLSALSGSRLLGGKLAELRLLLTPEERELPAIMARHQELIDNFTTAVKTNRPALPVQMPIVPASEKSAA